MGRRSKIVQHLPPVPDCRDLSALRKFITYTGTNEVLQIAKQYMLSGPALAFLLICCSNQTASRMQIMNDPDCRAILIEDEKLLQCSSGCGGLVWYANPDECDRCAQTGPVLRSSRSKKASKSLHAHSGEEEDTNTRNVRKRRRRA